MYYRVVTNGTDFKIQRIGGGPTITRGFFEDRWSYKFKLIKKWQDMRKCDLETEYADIAFNIWYTGNVENAKSVKLFPSKLFAISAMNDRIKRDKRIISMDDWESIYNCELNDNQLFSKK